MFGSSITIRLAISKQASKVNSWFARTAAVLFALISSFAGAATIGPGYSGMWYDPARSGEGLQLDILDADKAVVYWFTYDDSGKQRWLFGTGQIVRDASGDSIRFAELDVTHGGKFGQGFKPADVAYAPVGNVSLTFGDCNTGTFKYTAYGQSQTLPIQRLTQTMGAGCQSINGVPGEPVQAYAGQSGNWYDTAHSGEGFDLHWVSNNQAIVSWYTYDTQGNQVWLMGVGSPQNGSIVFDHLFSTSGPKFGAAFDPTKYQEHDWGSLTMTLNCESGTAHYVSTQAGFGSGDFTLTRLTALQQPACPYVAPKFSDLYSVMWDELPIQAGTPIYPNATFVDSIAADGTVAGRHSDNLVLWHPDTRTWEEIPRDLRNQAPVFISPDGLSVIATDATNSAARQTLLWQRSTNWQALVGNAFSASDVGGVSKSFQFIAGEGQNGNEPYQAWIRTIDGAQQVLPVPDGFIDAGAGLVSNDGKVVIGGATRSFTFVGDWPVVDAAAIRWVDGEAPTILHSQAGDELVGASDCNADCSIIYGNRINKAVNPSQSDGTPWFLKSDGTFGNLGALSDGYSTSAYGAAGVYSVTSTTSDGSIAVGNYIAIKYLDYPVLEIYATRAFIWTQASGMVSVRTLASELGIGDDDWQEIDTVRLSPDGLHVLLGGFHDGSDLSRSRAVVLHLTPKASPN